VKAVLLLAAGLAVAGCDGSIEAGGSGVDAGVDDDPLAVDDAPEPGSFDDLHRTIIAPRCSGQPGLCHNGQFEPNLSSPSLAYAYLVNRPAIEKPSLWRVAPGEPDASVLIDKLRGRDVATVMPLGADPLAEADIAAIEAWIEDGALRRPGDAPAPVLNEPPRRPEVGVFEGATRLDGATTTIQVGDTITFRHSVHDFETADAAIPFGAMLLSTGDGPPVVLLPAATQDPHVAPTAYDAAGPMGNGDLLNWRFTWTVPATIELYDEATMTRTPVAAAGQTLYVVAVYLDQASMGIAAFTFDPRPIMVVP
jgi:hypothetical protein